MPEDYFYVDFPAPVEEEGGDCFDIPLSWHDLNMFLSLPKRESRLRPEAASLIREYLNAGAFEAEANRFQIPKEHIFFNFVPLALNAGIALHSHVSHHVRPGSIEARSFLNHFATVHSAITQRSCDPSGTDGVSIIDHRMADLPYAVAGFLVRRQTTLDMLFYTNAIDPD